MHTCTRLAVTTIAALALAACGGTDRDAGGADPSSATPAEAAATDTGSPSDGGAADDPGALYGADVCVALLPALEGDVAGLERWAADEVLAVLSEGGADGAADFAEVFVDAGGTCSIGMGDAWFELTLEGDDRGGDRAVASALRMGIDNPSAYDEGAAPDDGNHSQLAEDVAAYRGSGDACGGAAADLPDGVPDHVALAADGLTVAAVVCETFAYQSEFELMGWSHELGVFPLEVEQWGDGAVVVDARWTGNPEVVDGMLSGVTKYRGAGDCGLWQRWTVDGDRLLLDVARERSCDAAGDPGAPETWPTVHPSTG